MIPWNICLLLMVTPNPDGVQVQLPLYQYHKGDQDSTHIKNNNPEYPSTPTVGGIPFILICILEFGGPLTTIYDLNIYEGIIKLA